MAETNYYLPGADALSVPSADADALISLRDGECALLYLYILRSRGALDEKRAAEDLGLAEDAVRAAAERLGKAGLLRRGGARPLPPAEELPEYSVRDILQRSESDRSFRALVTEAQRVLGHALSGADLKTLFGIYDRLEKEAFRWANREIFTAERAESFMAEQDRLEQEEERLRRVLQISDRNPTSGERKYMESWLSMGFGSEALALAYDRTVMSTGRLTWAYMDKIVRSWYEKGLFTPEDIEKGDRRPSRRQSGERREPSRTGGNMGDDLDKLASMYGVGAEKDK